MIRKFLIITVISIAHLTAFGQDWQRETKKEKYFESIQLDDASIEKIFKMANPVIDLPIPNGGTLSFKLTPNTTMSEG